MGKAVTRGQALELVGQFCRDTDWDALSSEGVQTIIDLSPEERTARFTDWLKNGASLVVMNGVAADTVSTPVLPEFGAWRSFLIGGVAYKALLARVKAGYQVSSYAEDLMRQKAFTTLPAEEAIDTIILTPADFGYERNPSTTELLDPARLAQWSRENAHRLPEGCVVELLPTEAGPHIRDQYKDQPKGEVLWIAMERIVGSDRFPRVFAVGRSDDGEQWLHTGWTYPGFQWFLGRRLVFRLRKVA